MAVIVVLAGGVGAARFLEGLVRVVPPSEIVVVGNTADDAEFYGLHVSPDLDIVCYTLAGIVEERQGWGVRGDTTAVLEGLRRYGHDTWFLLGDRDLATHIHRTHLLRQGVPLSAVTDSIRRALGIECRIVPMSDDRVETMVRTPAGWLAFQEYFVRRRAADEVLEIAFAGIERARPAPGVLEAIGAAAMVLIAPSNPIVSIGPILAVPGVRAALRESPARVAAVSPIVGGVAIKGPADRMLRALGHDVSPAGVAMAYQDILDALVLDRVDAALAPRVEEMGIVAVVTDTIMRDLPSKEALARAALAAAGGKV